MQNPEDEIVIEQEDVSPDKKLKKLREQLTAAISEKQEYLSGWQRSQADFVNMKRELTDKVARAEEAGRADIVASLLPILDALTGALADPLFSSLPESVQQGVRNIEKSFRTTLAAHGFESFDGEGASFDPHLHESVSTEETKEKERDHTIAAVLLEGWKKGEHIIRPATVRVYTYTK